MIALLGLLLTTRRFKEAKSVLRSFAGALNDGVYPMIWWLDPIIPYASLWFINAVYSYYEHSKDQDLIRELWQSLLDVVKRYSSTRDDFRMDEDGLIRFGPALT